MWRRSGARVDMRKARSGARGEERAETVPIRSRPRGRVGAVRLHGPHRDSRAVRGSCSRLPSKVTQVGLYR